MTISRSLDTAKPRVRVVERTAYDAGSCLGCKTTHGNVFEIGDGWISRYCRACLLDILQSALVLGECEECGHHVITPLRRLK